MYIVHMTSKSLKIKTFNHDNFQKWETLGQGKFGKVFKVFDKKRGTTVVIKKIDRTKTTERDILAEVTALSMAEEICHKNIVCSLDFAENGQHFYIVTEYLGDYMTLDQLNGISDARRLRIADNLIQGLHDLHQIEIAHRDIKPENLMVHATSTNIKYIDFGFSCDRETCQIQRLVGSPIYSAPELLALDIHDVNYPNTLEKWFKTDIWSLGLVLLELCCNLFSNEPERARIIEFLAVSYGLDLENETTAFDNLVEINQMLYDTGITQEMLDGLYLYFPVSPVIKDFISKRVQPMVKGKPDDRHL